MFSEEGEGDHLITRIKGSAKLIPMMMISQ